MKKNKLVLGVSVLVSIVFILFLIKTTDDLGKIDKTLSNSPNVENVTEKLQTKILISKEEPTDWFSLNFIDQSWKSIQVPRDYVPKEPGFEEGAFIFYRMYLPKSDLTKIKHLQNESVLNLYYVLFSRVDIYVNGRFYQTNKQTNYNEAIIEIPISENSDNLIALKGYIKTGDKGISHRGLIFAGKKAELSELHRKSYKGTTVLSLVFIFCKGSIFLIFTLIFMVVNVERYFEKSLLFSLFVLMEDILTGDFVTGILNFHQMVALYDIANIGMNLCLFLFLNDVIQKSINKRYLILASSALVVLATYITIDSLFYLKFFTIDSFLKFWNIVLLTNLMFFIPRLFRNSKSLAMSLVVAGLMTVWSTFFSQNVGNNLKAFSNLLIFLMVAYETFLLFKRQQIQLLEQQKDVAIGKTAAILAHDVRRPLDQMSLLLNRIVEGEADKDFLKIAQQDIQYSLNSVNSQISDMMNFSRTQELQLRPIGLYGVLSSSLKQVMSVARNVDIKLEYHFNSRNLVMADESRLGSAISNILVNAVEAIRDIGKKKSGMIRLETSNQGSSFCLKIVNDGPQIPPNVLENMFKPLFTSGKSQGTGLGLASVMKIIKDHGGSIKVANSPEGVEFTLLLNSSDKEENILMEEFHQNSKDFGYEEKFETKADKRKMRVFVLDDDKYVFEYVKNLIKRCDYDVELATFGTIEEAETALKTKRYDLHLLDYDLGGAFTGLDFYNKNLKHLKTTVVLHSGRTDVSLPDNRIEAVQKPIDIHMLNKVLKRADENRVKILLIEDSKLIGVAWKMFHGWGNIIHYHNPIEAIEYIRTHIDGYDVCVTDFNFDNSSLTGEDVIREVSIFNKNKKVILMTNAELETKITKISKNHYEIRSMI